MIGQSVPSQTGFPKRLDEESVRPKKFSICRVLPYWATLCAETQFRFAALVSRCRRHREAGKLNRRAACKPFDPRQS
jgi:hypothetical protein